MKLEPRNRYFGTPLSEWIDRVPNELAVDAVGLWQLVGSGEDGFELRGAELNDFVRRCIVALFEHGAVPVLPSEDAGVFWAPQRQYGDNAEEAARRIVEEWVNSGSEPDHDGLWFYRFPALATNSS